MKVIRSFQSHACVAHVVEPEPLQPLALAVAEGHGLGLPSFRHRGLSYPTISVAGSYIGGMSPVLEAILKEGLGVAFDRTIATFDLGH